MSIQPMKVCSECSGIFDVGVECCPKDGSENSKALKPGDRLLGRYEYIECLGEGGMGVIYHARHDVFDKSVAIKILKSNDFAMEHLKRFELEAKAISRLHHPNIITVHEFGTSEFGYPYMVIDYVEGRTLAKLLEQEGYLSPTLAVEIVLEICSAVQHAHENSIIHRDLKPSNVMLKKTNGVYDVKVLDFGIAKVVDTQQGLDHELTRTGAIFGSPLCMSPEQAQGKKVDHRSDIYSLGCILYEALTGAPPLMGGTVIETMVKQINETPMSLHDASLGRDFPPLLEGIVFRALEKDPEKRFQSVKEFADSLRACMEQLPEFVDEPQGKWLNIKQLFKARFERPEGIALALVAGFCLILAVAGYFFVTDTSGNTNNANSKTLDDDFARIKTVIAPHDQKEVATKVFSEPKDSVEDEQSFPEQLATVSPEIVIKSMIRYAKGHDGEISLDRLAFTGKTLDMLAGSAELQTLYIKHCIVGDIFFDHITGIPLKKLSIEYLDISDAGMAKIHDLPGLSFLEMKRIGPQEKYQHIGAAGLVGLARLPHLRTLLLKDERLTDEDLSALPGIKRLKALELTNNSDLTAKAARYIEQLGDLEELTTRLSRIPLSALEGMKNFPNLRTLCLSESNRFTRQDLEQLCERGKSLESLDLSKTKIDDHQLSALRNMKKLRELNISNCRNLQQSAVQRLSSELPDCLITSDFK